MSYRLANYFSCITFVFLCGLSFSQAEIQKRQRQIDSLTSVLKRNSSDTTRVNRLNELSRLLSEHQKSDQALVRAKEAVTLSEKLKFDRGNAASYASMGTAERETGDLDKALISLNTALQWAGKSKFTGEEGFIYDQLGHLYWAKGDTLSSLNCHKQSLLLREKTGNLFHQAQSNGNIAAIYSGQGKLKEAAEYYKKSLRIYQQLNETSRIAWASGNAGLMNYWLGDRSEALKYFIISLKNYEEDENEDGIIWVSSLLSNVYKSIQEFDKALKYVRKVQEMHKKSGDKLGEGDAYSLMGGIYFEMKDLSKSYDIYNKALGIYTEFKDSIGIMNVLLNRGTIHFEEKNYDLSLQDVLNSLELATVLNQFRIAAHCKKMIGAVYAVKGDAGTAKKWLHEALDFFKETESVSSFSFVYKYLVKADSLDGDFNSAFEHYKRYVQYKDESKKSHVDTEKIAMTYEFEKKAAVAKAELRTKKIQRNAAIAGLILMGLFTILLVYFFRLRSKKIQVEKQNLAFQKREIETIRETEQFKSRFLANISHEFRTPLTLINGHLEVLQESGNEQDLFRFREMESNGKRLLQLINQLLELSKMEDGEYKLKFQAGNVLKETAMLVQSFHSLAQQKKIHVSLNQPEFQEKMFIYSREAVSVIMSNLLSNAFKYTPEEGTITVNIDLREDELLIRVANTGMGIAPEHLPKIFDRFYQVDEPYWKSYEGSGIGLALVKELALLHGGEVWVESPEQEGCIFFVRIKSAGEQCGVVETEINAVSLGMTGPDREEDNQPGEDELPLILIVEDQNELRRFISENLGTEYRYAEASNGKEGIRLAEELVPDLIISDIMMPDTDGLELCAHLKNSLATSHIPIILLTAKADQKDKLTGLEFGADDYLVKPFSLAELKLRARNRLRTRHLLQQKMEGMPLPFPDDVPELNKRDREFIEKLNDIVESNLSDSLFSVPALSEALILSASQLNRKVKSLTGKTPADYIRNKRLQKAVELLKEGRGVAEVGWKVGFEDAVYFSKVFKKHFGYAPSQMKKE